MNGGCRSSWPLRRVVGHHAAVGHHDLQVGRVHPDAPVQIPLVLLDRLGAHVEDVAIHLIHFLPAHILDVVLGNIRRGQHKRIAVLDVLKVGGRHHHAASACLAGANTTFSVRAPEGSKITSSTSYHSPSTLLSSSSGLHPGHAAVRVVVQRLLELGLLGRKLLDDLLRGNRRSERSMRPKPESSGIGVNVSLSCAAAIRAQPAIAITAIQRCITTSARLLARFPQALLRTGNLLPNTLTPLQL